MKNLLFKSFLFCLLSAVMMGCVEKPVEPKDEFGVELKTVEADYVEVEISAPSELEIAYTVATEPQALSPAVLFVTGTTLKVTPGQVLKITDGIVQSTTYYLYVAAKLDAQNFSEIFTLPFKTTDFNFEELVSVIDRRLDGYRIRLTLPQSTKDAGNAIRWNQCCLMMYNYMSQSNDYFSLLYNAGHQTTEDVTLVYSEDEN